MQLCLEQWKKLFRTIFFFYITFRELDFFVKLFGFEVVMQLSAALNWVFLFSHFQRFINFLQVIILKDFGIYSKKEEKFTAKRCYFSKHSTFLFVILNFEVSRWYYVWEINVCFRTIFSLIYVCTFYRII